MPCTSFAEIPNKNKKLVICSNNWFDGDPDDYLELDLALIANRI